MSLAPTLDFVFAQRAWPIDDDVKELCTRLPDVACAGIEFSLQGRGPVDAQVRIRSQNDIEAAKQLYFSHPDLHHTPDLQILDRVLRLCDNGRIPEPIEEFWLELDQHKEKHAALSVFTRLSPDESKSPSISKIVEICHALGHHPPPTQLRALEIALQASKRFDSYRLPFLGMMHCRPGTPICPIFDGILPGQIGNWLQSVGWTGNISRLQSLVTTIQPFFDRLRVVLPIGLSPGSELGIECFLGSNMNFDPRWSETLNTLVDLGFCSAQLRDKIEKWPDQVTPSLTKPCWPEKRILDALRRSTEKPRWFDCRLSHIKFSYSDDREIRAKGYLGYMESQHELRIHPRHKKPSPSTASMQTKSIDSAIEAAENYLASKQTNTGWWLDYPGYSEGISDEWVTAYVGATLMRAPSKRRTELARRAWDQLRGRLQRRQGWGWNLTQPVDADSTAWGLSVGRHFDTTYLQGSIAILGEHIGKCGAASTYNRNIYQSTQPDTNIQAQWFDPHDCVTAAIALLPEFQNQTIGRLSRTQSQAGYWHGYWWTNPVYPTALAVRALASACHSHPANRSAITRSANWAAQLARERFEERNVFERALLMEIQSHALVHEIVNDSRSFKSEIADILNQQQSDGSWTSGAALRIVNSTGHINIALDENRVFTTATVLGALTYIQSGYRGPTGN